MFACIDYQLRNALPNLESLTINLNNSKVTQLKIPLFYCTVICDLLLTVHYKQKHICT